MTPANPDDGVKVLETCRVAPSNVSPETAALKSLPLTFLDVPWLGFAPTRRLLFYGISDPSPPTVFSDVVLPRLKRSLAVTLGQYLPLAGTLTWPPDADEPFLKFDDVVAAGTGGVSLTVAASDAHWELISGYGIRDATESHPLVPKLRAMDTEAEIVALQVTAFGNRGFSVGIATHHAILDGRTSTMFLKAWALACRLVGDGDAVIDLSPDMTPLFDRTEIRDPNGVKKAFLEMRSAGREPGGESKGLKIKDSKKEEPQDRKVRRLRGTFVLSRADVEKLRYRADGWVIQHREQLTGVRISTFVLTCAYACVCLAKAGEFDGDADPTVHFVFATDCRARMDPPVPANYFGNCLEACGGNFEFSDLAGDHGVAAAAATLSEEIKKLRESKFSMEPKRGPPRGADPISRRRRMISVAGSPKFGVYGTDFGWGRPRRAEIVSVEDTGAIGLTESREDNGGVEVGLVLDEDKMEAFAAAFAHGLE